MNKVVLFISKNVYVIICYQIQENQPIVFNGANLHKI